MTKKESNDAKELFETNLSLINEIVDRVCRRGRLVGAEADDFRSEVMLKLIRDDYRVLRRFAGHSALATFLTVVIQRLLTDTRVRDWGRWRNTEAARRSGPAAVRLERLIHRDGLTAEEAVETLSLDPAITQSRRELRDLAETLPHRRTRPRTWPLTAELAASGAGPDHRLVEFEKARSARTVTDALTRVLSKLDAEEVAILRLRFARGRTVAAISRRLGLNQRRLYRRLQSILNGLGAKLVQEGVDRPTALGVVGDRAIHLKSTRLLEKAPARPSNTGERRPKCPPMAADVPARANSRR